MNETEKKHLKNLTHQGRTKSPCKGCADRSPECHAKCEKYAEYNRIHAQEAKDIHKKRREFYLGFGAQYRSDKEFKSQHLKTNKQIQFQRQEQRLKERMNNNEHTI